MARDDRADRAQKPILVEILAYAPTQYFHCQHCEFVWQQTGATKQFHQESLESSIPQELYKEFADLSAWVLDTVEAYDGRVVFKVVDAASVEGLLKSVRYGARKYPAFIIDGRTKYTGLDFMQARRLIDREVEMAPAPS